MDSGIIDDGPEIDDEFRRELDSLYVLPLRMLPLKSNYFRRGRMIKDNRLESAIEVFSNQETGSGRIYPNETKPEAFDEAEEGVREDFELLTKLGQLQSFDVYSLRICLRELDVSVRSEDYLSLSRDKRDELKDRMTVFTQPLLREVYGQTDIAAAEAADLVKLFSNPDVDVALDRLRALSSLLDIELGKIPKFLEDFSDIYLSLAYYEQCIEEIRSQTDRFREDLRALQSNWQLRQNGRLMDVCKAIDKLLTRFDTGVQERFDSFNANTDKMWENLSAQRFRKIEAVIMGHHTMIGGILCGVGSKMDAWTKLFPDPRMGGPVARSDALMAQIVPGMDKISDALKSMEELDFNFDDEPGDDEPGDDEPGDAKSN